MQGKELAEVWLKHAEEQFSHKSGGLRECVPDVDWPNFYIVRAPHMKGIPAVLIEHAFMSNADDLELLKSDEFRNKAGFMKKDSECMRKFLSAVFVLFIVLTLSGCVYKANSHSSVYNISIEDLNRNMQSEDEDLILIDVREPIEYLQKHINGSVLFPVDSIMTNTSILNKDNNYAIICAKGARSSLVAEYLVSQGFPSISNVVGGISEWKGPVITNSINIITDTREKKRPIIGKLWPYQEDITDVNGVTIKISEMVKDGPVAILFYANYENT